ncbi:MAG TPA: Tol-Pal system beta propeller repeat protein TolB [Gammaproteobacteria bacterium]|nr:Tol-Pal system beta propeller repeat protein TolB [Gammaproteobacteria bacterium]
MYNMLRKIIFISLVLISSQAWAVLDIEITGGVVGEQPIAIVPFSWEIPEGVAKTDVSRVLSADLRRTGRFSQIPEKNFLEHPHHGGEVNFEKWRELGVENLVVGRVRPGRNGTYLVQFQLFDIFRHSKISDGGPSDPEYKIKQVIGYSLPTTKKDLRRTAHYMSDLIYEALTGQKGVFRTRIAYVTAKGTINDRKYALKVADMDGYNPATILSSNQPVMSPSWSPDARRLAYVSFENKKAQIFIQDVDTGKRYLVADQRGINNAPSWSPDGKKLALTLSRDGNLEIYTLDISSKRLRRVTRNTAIDTEANWSPDGQSIVFTSDRSGRPQVYRIRVAGGRAERLTFQGKENARPGYSPDGKKIALVHKNQEGYHIAMLDIEAGIIKVLTNGSLDESPSFAPNGSMILFAASNRGRGVLSVVSVDNNATQSLVLQQGDVREPAWAPYRK